MFKNHILNKLILIFLEKKEKPEFLKKPEDVTVTEQEDAVFETEVVAKPAPVVEW